MTEGHIGWADRIFAMERKHVRRLQAKFSDSLRDKPLVCLDIPDDFRFMDEELIELLKSRVSEHIEVPD